MKKERKIRCMVTQNKIQINWFLKILLQKIKRRTDNEHIKEIMLHYINQSRQETCRKMSAVEDLVSRVSRPQRERGRKEEGGKMRNPGNKAECCSDTREVVASTVKSNAQITSTMNVWSITTRINSVRRVSHLPILLSRSMGRGGRPWKRGWKTIRHFRTTSVSNKSQCKRFHIEIK